MYCARCVTGITFIRYVTGITFIRYVTGLTFIRYVTGITFIRYVTVITFIWYVTVITFIRSAHSQKTGKPKKNELNVFVSKKTKGSTQDSFI